MAPSTLLVARMDARSDGLTLYPRNSMKIPLDFHKGVAVQVQNVQQQ